jgi:hypothetical protein
MLAGNVEACAVVTEIHKGTEHWEEGRLLTASSRFKSAHHLGCGATSEACTIVPFIFMDATYSQDGR